MIKICRGGKQEVIHRLLMLMFLQHTLPALHGHPMKLSKKYDCDRQTLFGLNLKIWDWGIIIGRVLQTISLSCIRLP